MMSTMHSKSYVCIENCVHEKFVRAIPKNLKKYIERCTETRLNKPPCCWSRKFQP